MVMGDKFKHSNEEQLPTTIRILSGENEKWAWWNHLEIQRLGKDVISCWLIVSIKPFNHRISGELYIHLSQSSGPNGLCNSRAFSTLSRLSVLSVS